MYNTTYKYYIYRYSVYICIAIYVIIYIYNITHRVHHRVKAIGRKTRYGEMILHGVQLTSQLDPEPPTLATIERRELEHHHEKKWVNKNREDHHF